MHQPMVRLGGVTEEYMSKELLSRFTNPEYEKQAAPFSWGDYSYATNGHVLVRVRRLSDVPEELDAFNERAAKLFDDFDMPVVLAALVDIPDFPQPDPEKCSVCKGVGKITRCPECEGKGYIEFETDYNDYEVDCATCHGHGSTIGDEQICDCCNGTGTKKVMKRIDIGCTGLSSHYLTMLKDLPGIQIAPTEPVRANYFKWDDGEGLLMPMRA